MHTTNPNAETVTAIASAIANCDFRVTIQRYITGQGRPWIITVGETWWQRHIVVEVAEEDGSDATLAILSPEQSENFGYEIGAGSGNIDRHVTLKELIAKGFTSVKAVLRPEREAA